MHSRSLSISYMSIDTSIAADSSHDESSIASPRFCLAAAAAAEKRNNDYHSSSRNKHNISLSPNKRKITSSHLAPPTSATPRPGAAAITACSIKPEPKSFLECCTTDEEEYREIKVEEPDDDLSSLRDVSGEGVVSTTSPSKKLCASVSGASSPYLAQEIHNQQQGYLTTAPASSPGVARRISLLQQGRRSFRNSRSHPHRGAGGGIHGVHAGVPASPVASRRVRSKVHAFGGRLYIPPSPMVNNNTTSTPLSSLSLSSSSGASSATSQSSFPSFAVPLRLPPLSPFTTSTPTRRVYVSPLPPTATATAFTPNKLRSALPPLPSPSPVGSGGGSNRPTPTRAAGATPSSTHMYHSPLTPLTSPPPRDSSLTSTVRPLSRSATMYGYAGSGYYNSRSSYSYSRRYHQSCKRSTMRGGGLDSSDNDSSDDGGNGDEYHDTSAGDDEEEDGDEDGDDGLDFVCAGKRNTSNGRISTTSSPSKNKNNNNNASPSGLILRRGKRIKPLRL